MSTYIQKPLWWTEDIDRILSDHYHNDKKTPFDINRFKTQIAACHNRNGKPWDPSLCDIDLVIEILHSKISGSCIRNEARHWVLNKQWSDTEPKRYRELGMVCTNCGRETTGQIYMRKRNVDPSDKSGIGFPRAGCCGSDKIMVLNPMPKDYAEIILGGQAIHRFGNCFEEIDSDDRVKILASVRGDRMELVRRWLLCQAKVQQAEAGIGEEGPSTLRHRKYNLVDAKGILDRAGGVFLWNKAYDDMPKVLEDDFPKASSMD